MFVAVYRVASMASTWLFYWLDLWYSHLGPSKTLSQILHAHCSQMLTVAFMATTWQSPKIPRSLRLFCDWWSLNTVSCKMRDTTRSFQHGSRFAQPHLPSNWSVCTGQLMSFQNHSNCFCQRTNFILKLVGGWNCRIFVGFIFSCCSASLLDSSLQLMLIRRTHCAPSLLCLYGKSNFNSWSENMDINQLPVAEI